MHMSMDCPLLGAVPGSTYGPMLLAKVVVAVPKHQLNLPFVGIDSYCEWGDTTKRGNRLAWEDPLWDGERCTNCCQGPWFHKEVPPTTDNIEVRWCCDQNQGDEDFYTDIVEIWVL